MQWATGADCQTYFRTRFLVFFSESNFGANSDHTALSVSLEWDSMTGLAAEFLESMKHLFALLRPRRETSGQIQWHKSCFYSKNVRIWNICVKGLTVWQLETPNLSFQMVHVGFLMHFLLLLSSSFAYFQKSMILPKNIWIISPPVFHQTWLLNGQKNCVLISFFFLVHYM